jgi:hypothetical protein
MQRLQRADYTFLRAHGAYLAFSSRHSPRQQDIQDMYNKNMFTDNRRQPNGLAHLLNGRRRHCYVTWPQTSCPYIPYTLATSLLESTS